MPNYFEVDFMDVETKRSGDAISIRYEIDGITTIHIVDAGFQETGPKIVEKIRNNYGSPQRIDHVVATHPDGDHAGGLRTVLNEFEIGTLWMHRPWLHADELIEQFSRFSNVENLKKRLKEIYPNIVALEEIANAKGIAIKEAFQGTKIGAFTVMSPTKSRYLDLVVESEKTPEAIQEETRKGLVSTLLDGAITLLKAAWGDENFSSEDTSAENEMSIVQYACLSERKILLTADVGRSGLQEVIDYAPSIGLTLPGIDVFQVPHHGSRRNVSTELLDSVLGDKKSGPTAGSFHAIICASTEDKDHPRKAVIRAMIHRGGTVYTSANNLASYGGERVSGRDWSAATPLDYPDDQEE